MPLVPSTLTLRKVLYGLATVLLLIGISLAVGADPSRLSNRVSSASQHGTPSPVASPTSLPIAPNPTQGPSPSGVASPSPSPIVSPSPDVRDLGQYENAGSLTIGVNVSSGVHDAVMNQARTFLWRKWTERAMGRLSLVTTNLAGRLETRNFYVERDSVGTWKITIEMADTEPADFYFVEQVGVTADGRPILDPPGGPPAVSSALHLKPTAEARNGKVL